MNDQIYKMILTQIMQRDNWINTDLAKDIATDMYQEVYFELEMLISEKLDKKMWDVDK